MSDLHPMDLCVFHVGDVQPANPAAGAGMLQPLEFGRVEILSLTATLVTSAAVANRYIGAAFSLFGIFFAWHAYCPLAQTGGLTHIYTWQRGIAPFFNVLDPSGYTSIGFGTNMFIPGAGRIEINVINMQAADQLSDIAIIYASWPTPNYPV
jgi:hypothetical protein